MKPCLGEEFFKIISNEIYICTYNFKLFYRVPSKGEQRIKWIEVVEKIQKFQHNRKEYNVCIRHFEPGDYEKKGNKFILKHNAIPSIFEKNSVVDGSFEKSDSFDFIDEIVGHEIIDDTIKNVKCVQCPFLLEKIAELKREILRMTTDHSISVQKLELKNIMLKKNTSNKDKQLKESEKQNIQLKDILEEMKSEQYISDDEKNFLNVFEMREVVECLCKGVKGRDSYPPSVRAFCMSLHYMSPRAYDYLRNKFGKHLPHCQTIRQWYRNSNLDAKSGIGTYALNALESKAKTVRENGEQLVVSVVFDEMHIQRNMSWCRAKNKFIGLIDYGTQNPDDEFTLAKDVIVFMACGINAHFQQPIGYYFIQTLNANERAELLLQVINEISKRGIKVANVTFDGYRANVKMCRHLGANLNLKNGEYETHFINSYDSEKIYFILDPSHVMKLIRNTLGGVKSIYEGENEIKWQYFEDLVSYSGNKEFGLTHKMNKRHIQYSDRKMHVRTAVETLSQSTADSMQFLKDHEVENFINADATIKFTRMFNKLWDVMNSQRVRGGNNNTFKSAINCENAAEVFSFLNDAKTYILSLNVISKRTGSSIPIVKSDYNTGFGGFIIDIISVTAMYREYVENRHWMLFIATYRLSQDHLEMLFGMLLEYQNT